MDENLNEQNSAEQEKPIDKSFEKIETKETAITQPTLQEKDRENVVGGNQGFNQTNFGNNQGFNQTNFGNNQGFNQQNAIPQYNYQQQNGYGFQTSYNAMVFKNSKLYNPNNFNAYHTAIICILIAVAFAILSLIIGLIASVLFDNTMNGYILIQIVGGLFIDGLLISFVAIFCKIANVGMFNGGGFLVRKSGMPDVFMGLVIGAGVVLALSSVATQAGAYITDFQSAFVSVTDGLSSIEGDEVYAIPALFYLLVTSCLAPAFFEELFFRGVVMRGLSQFGKVTAVVLSALLFALFHGNVQQLLFQFMGGLVIGFAVMQTKNLLVGMAIHFANNFFAVLPSLIATLSVAGITDETTGMAVYGLIMFVSMVFGIICLIAGGVYFGKKIINNALNKKMDNEQITSTVYVPSYLNERGEQVFKAEERAWFENVSQDRKDDLYFKGKDDKPYKINKKASVVGAGIVIALAIIVQFTFIILDFLNIL